MAGVLATNVTQSDSEPIGIVTEDIDRYRYEVRIHNYEGLNDDEAQALVHRAVVRAIIKEIKTTVVEAD